MPKTTTLPSFIVVVERTAAFGSSIISNISKPALSPADFIPSLCRSLKKAGTLITTFNLS